MKRRNHKWAKDADRRTCARCGRGIEELWPVYLVGAPSGRIVGPFHAACAHWLAWRALSGHDEDGQIPGDTYGTILPHDQEATIQ